MTNNNGRGTSLESCIQDAACSILGAKDEAKYKDFILPLIVTRRLCDVFDVDVDRIAAMVASRKEAFQLVKADHRLLRFYLPLLPDDPGESVWSIVDKPSDKIGEGITTHRRAIARENHALQNNIDRIDLNAATLEQRDIDDDRLSNLIEAISIKHLGLKDVEADIIGKSYTTFPGAVPILNKVGPRNGGKAKGKDSRVNASQVFEKGGVPRFKEQFARFNSFGRFVSGLQHRTKRSRIVLVLLMAGALVVGCGRDYIMPPADVQLPEFQAQSLYSEGLCVVSDREDRRRGYMDLDGRIVIEPAFFAAGPFNGGLAPVQREVWDHFGYIDKQGRTVIEAGFDAALPFAGDLAPVRVDGLWGFIDRQGRAVVPPKFDLAFAFAEGRARVVVAGFAGFIDESGKVIVEAQYYRAGDYNEGLAMVCDGRRCGFINRAGMPVIALDYDDAGSFAEGLAPVRKGVLWGYIDRTGRMVIPPAFDQAGSFADGLARVSRHGRFDGFIDREGRETIKTRMSGTAPFSEGRTVVSVPSHGFTSDATDNRIIDTQGKFLPGRFNGVSAFQEGRAVVSSIIGRKSYMIDRDGRPLIELASSIPGDYERFVRHNPDARFGYIDPEGRTVIDHTWLTAHPFSEGLAFVESPHQNRRRTRGYVDATGHLVISVSDDIARTLPFTDGLALVARLEQGHFRYGYLDRSGEVRIGFDYADAAPFREGLAAVKRSRDLDAHDWGYIDTNGAVVIPPRFYRAGCFGSGLAYIEVISRERCLQPAIIDRTGAVVVAKPFLFEWSQLLFGGPSLERFHSRGQMVFDDVLIPRYDDAARGYVDGKDRLVIPGGRYQMMGVFREGRAPVSIDGRFGYIDTAGELVIEARFASVHPFSEGLAAVRDMAGRTGYITRDGAWAVEPLWLEEAHAFAAGRARVKLNGHYGFLDATGRFVVPPIYLGADDFHEGLATVALPTRPKTGRAVIQE